MTAFVYVLSMETKAITSIYEIKKGRTKSMVRATSMKAMADWAKDNGVKSWSTGWMYSAVQLEQFKSLPVVA